mgnify:CR=1 FL=1
MYFYDFPVGRLYIEENNGFIVKISFSKINSEIKESALIKYACNQLNEYFQGIRKYFDIPIKPKGTEFQMKVWDKLLEIPYGETKTYKYIAESIGLKKGYQAIGFANKKNPLPIIIPCHRVIGIDGNLTGYIGGLEIKSKLLKTENLYK